MRKKAECILLSKEKNGQLDESEEYIHGEGLFDSVVSGVNKTKASEFQEKWNNFPNDDARRKFLKR